MVTFWAGVNRISIFEEKIETEQVHLDPIINGTISNVICDLVTTFKYNLCKGPYLQQLFHVVMRSKFGIKYFFF